jgi:hypothetical protein
MYKPILLAALTMLSVAVHAQNVTDPSQEFSKNSASTDLPVNGFNKTEDALQIIANIMNVVGLEPNFKVKTAKIPNVEAEIRHKQRYILYNPDFISYVNKTAGDKWPSIFILAHEIGHHLNGHTLLGISSRPDIELEADEFAGFILEKLGASLYDAQLAMKIIANIDASDTHPGRLDRMNAIEKGWRKAEGTNAH